MQLSDDILPKPKTKVTTTVRTYTYEIPEPDCPYVDRDPPKNTAVFYKTERNERSGNFYPANQSPPVNTNQYPPLSIQEAPPHNTTTVYKYDVTNTSPMHGQPQQPPHNSTTVYKYDVVNTNTVHGQPHPPPHNTTTVYKYDVTNTSPLPGQPQPQVPPGGITIYPPQNTTIYKTETVNTTNKQYRSPTPNSYPDNGPINHYPSHGYPPHSGYPHQPNEPSVVVYKQTTTNTRNVIHPRSEREPVLHPFPVDGPIITEVDGSPPKRVEDLMASFGDVSFNLRFVSSNASFNYLQNPFLSACFRQVKSITQTKRFRLPRSLTRRRATTWVRRPQPCTPQKPMTRVKLFCRRRTFRDRQFIIHRTTSCLRRKKKHLIGLRWAGKHVETFQSAN